MAKVVDLIVNNWNCPCEKVVLLFSILHHKFVGHQYFDFDFILDRAVEDIIINVLHLVGTKGHSQSPLDMYKTSLKDKRNQWSEVNRCTGRPWLMSACLVFVQITALLKKWTYDWSEILAPCGHAIRVSA